MKKIQRECLKLRQDFPTVQKALKNATVMLPEEPVSLVKSYINGSSRLSKETVVARRHSRFTKPALPELNFTEALACSCGGKCATKRCSCKANLRRCLIVIAKSRYVQIAETMSIYTEVAFQFIYTRFLYARVYARKSLNLSKVHSRNTN